MRPLVLCCRSPPRLQCVPTSTCIAPTKSAYFLRCCCTCVSSTWYGARWGPAAAEAAVVAVAQTAAQCVWKLRASLGCTDSPVLCVCKAHPPGQGFVNKSCNQRSCNIYVQLHQPASDGCQCPVQLMFRDEQSIALISRWQSVVMCMCMSLNDAVQAEVHHGHAFQNGDKYRHPKCCLPVSVKWSC